MAKIATGLKHKGGVMDEKQQTISLLDKLKAVESELYRQLEKAEHTVGILRCRKDDDRMKMNTSENYGIGSAFMGVLFGFALWGGIATGDPTTIGFASAGLATSAAAVGINVRSRFVCKQDMKNINNVISDIWKYHKSLESQLDFVKLKIKRLEQIMESNKIDSKEVDQVRNAKFEGKKTISMDENLRESINKLGANYSEADEVNLMV